MSALPAALDKLIALLSRLPGIGERSATRLALFIVSQPTAYAAGLGQALDDVAKHVRFCAACHMLSETELCGVCTDPGRDRSLMCVVESVQDLMAFERTGAYRGLYHVLHGVLSPLKGVGPDQLRLSNLEPRLAEGPVTEVIVATSTDVEGEATALYLARRLAGSGARISRIATGVPMGGDLEYIDQNTLARALKGRRELEV